MINEYNGMRGLNTSPYNGSRGGFLPVIAGIGTLITFFTAVSTVLLRHPIITKMLLFTLFIGLIVSVIDYIMLKVTPYIVQNEVTALLAYFGFFDALAIFIGIILAGFGTKQILAFVRTT